MRSVQLGGAVGVVMLVVGLTVFALNAPVAVW